MNMERYIFKVFLTVIVFKAPAVLWELEPITNLQEVGKSSFPHNGESPIR